MVAVPRGGLLRVGVVTPVLLVAVGLIGCEAGPQFRGQSPRPELRPVIPTEPRLLEQLENEPRSIPIDSQLIDVRVEGHQAIAANDILGKIQVQPGRPFSEAQVRGDVRRLFATRWFFSVEPVYRREAGGTVLIFRVVERPMVRLIAFRGNERLTDAKLAEEIALRTGSPFDISANREAAKTLREFYRKKGFAFATVELVKGNQRDDRDVVFQIEEGQKVVVAQVSFVGNEYTYATAGILRTKIKTKRAVLGVTLLGGKFKPEVIPQDKESIQDYYRGLGFFDVKVSHRVLVNDVVFNPLRRGDGNITIEYTIQEGPRYKVANVELRGNEVFTEEQLRQDFNITVGEYFNQRYMIKDVKEMKEKYGKLGRLFARVEPVTRFNESKPDEVDLVYDIDEDRPYLIGPIDVHFHGDFPHTKETVVLNRLLFQPGELADPSIIRRSERRLEGMIFERGPVNGPRIRVRPMQPEELLPRRPKPDVVRGQNREPAPLPQPYSPILENSPLGDPFGSLGRALIDPNYGQLKADIDVTEARTGRVMFGAGVNSDAGLVGSIVLDENNFDLFRPPSSFQEFADGTAWRGGGQRLRIEALPGNFVSRYLMSWSDPFFLDTDYSLSTSGFFFQRYYDDWDENRTGGRVTVGRQLTREWTLAGTLRLESVDLQERRPNPPTLLQEALGETWFTSGRVAITHDTRDSSFLPGEGHYLQANFEHAFGDFVFPRAQGDARQYFTLHERPDGNGRHVLALSSRIGWTGEDTPIYERFFAGGYQSFRGFDFRGVSPVDQGVGIGGRWMLLGSVEYKFPVTADEMISAVVFTDMGTVEEEVQMEDFRLTVGAGIRVTIPAMGPVPIALDWGIPVIKQDFDDRRLFSFYIGINR